MSPKFSRIIASTPPATSDSASRNTQSVMAVRSSRLYGDPGSAGTWSMPTTGLRELANNWVILFGTTIS